MTMHSHRFLTPLLALALGAVALGAAALGA